MTMFYEQSRGVIRPDGAFRHFGGIDPDEQPRAVTIDLSFRMATNGVIVNTLVNDEPVITTSAGQFNQ